MTAECRYIFSFSCLKQQQTARCVFDLEKTINDDMKQQNELPNQSICDTPLCQNSKLFLKM